MPIPTITCIFIWPRSRPLLTLLKPRVSYRCALLVSVVGRRVAFQVGLTRGESYAACWFKAPAARSNIRFCRNSVRQRAAFRFPPQPDEIRRILERFGQLRLRT